MSDDLTRVHNSMINIHLVQVGVVVSKVTLATQEQVAEEVTALIQRAAEASATTA